MDIRTFDNVLSDDLLQLVQIELNLFMYVKHTSTEGADNYFFASDTSNHSTHDFLLKYFNNKFNLDYKKIRGYVNCYPPQIGGDFHTDDGDYTYLFFPDNYKNIDKLGDLQFKDGPTISYKTNRLVVFDAKLLHKAHKNQTDKMRHTIAWKTSI